MRSRMAWIAAATATFLCMAAYLSAQTIEELEKQVQDSPAVKAKEALAEAYLRDCQLEKSLRVWQDILRRQPGHKRAKLVVERLTAQALDLDTQLDTLGTLIDRGVHKGTEALLDAAAQRAATDSQKAHILYLRGVLALRSWDKPDAPAAGEQETREEEEPSSQPAAEKPARRPAVIVPARRPAAAGDAPADPAREAAARPFFQGVMKLAPDSAWAARSAMALAKLELQAGRRDQARKLLGDVVLNKNLDDEAVRQTARFRLAMLESQDLSPRERIAALQELLPGMTAAPARRAVLDELVSLTTASRGRWVSEAVDFLALMLKGSSGFDETAAVLNRLGEVVRVSEDPAVLDGLVGLLKDFKSDDTGLSAQGAFLYAEALLARAVVEENAAGVRRLLADARAVLDKLAGGGAFADRARVGELRGQAYLVEAQKLIALEGPVGALPLLNRAREHYLGMLPARPEACLDRLANIARLLEHVKEWEMAVALYRDVADGFPYLPQGRDALMKAAKLLQGPLRNPMAALEVYAEYSSRYPAELPYRQLEVGYRLRRLGYANVLDFQKRNNLNPDGLMGPKTRSKLEEIERTFDAISVGDAAAGGVLRGQFVHDAIFAIAVDLERSGRARDAIAAYRMFINLFPTKAKASEALLSVARILRDNLLFEEALGAYAEAIEDFPKGEMTSEAYVESAGCLENLGRWKEAREFYELYLKKFPKYKHVALCKERMAMLDDIRQYQDFLAGNAQSPKAAEAQYQLATILYEKFKNHTKAAVEFQKVAESYPRHVRAPEGLYTAGAAFLKVENFPAARKVFERIVQDYRDSRLADDAQFWIGHTYEYTARALGKLDDHRIVLKRRSLAERERLLADLALRRTYYAKARGGPQVPEDVWGGDALGVLTSGSTRDRVNADLFRAIEAYRKVVDDFKTGDMAGNALLRIGTIYIQYLKDPDKGVKAYQELLAHYGATKEAVDALYEVGAYYLKNGNFDEAVKAYEQFIYNYPKDERVEDAMLAIARAYVEKKVWDKALDAYQSYMTKFPNGKSAEFAKAQIAWIRMYHF